MNAICRSTDAAVDRILLVHALEANADAAALLREVWRVLAAGGRILAIAPNRRGLWARMDTTPFGHGRPYSRSQITHLLRETWFTPTAWATRFMCRRSTAAGFCARRLPGSARAPPSAPFAGVHLVEATKQVYRAVPVKKKLVPILKPVLKPVWRLPRRSRAQPLNAERLDLLLPSDTFRAQAGEGEKDGGRSRSQRHSPFGREIRGTSSASPCPPCGRAARAAVTAAAAVQRKTIPLALGPIGGKALMVRRRRRPRR